MSIELADSIKQSGGTIYSRLMDDYYRRLNARPKTPPTPTLTTASAIDAAGTTYATVTVNWTNSRKDMDYIIGWKESTDSNYTYERARKSPHIIRPVRAGATIDVDLSQERRQTGARSPFTTDTSLSTPGDTTAPAAPSGLSCAADPSSGTIVLQWSPNTEGDLAFYNIYRGTSAGTGTKFDASLGTSWADFNSTPGTTYFYRVTAEDRSGNESAFSNETSCTVKFIGTIPVVPNKTSVTTVTAVYSTAIVQPCVIPAGSQILTVPVSVIANPLSGSPSIIVRFSVGSSGSNTSQEAQMNFSAGGDQRTMLLISAANLSVSGPTNILYQWRVTGGTFSGQLISAGSIEVS